MSADTTFADLGVPTALDRRPRRPRHHHPVPDPGGHAAGLPGRADVLGRGRTGSGKTYAFVLPVLARLAASGRKRRPNHPRALILAPTRELATQIQASITPLADALGLRTMTVFGGVGHSPQITGLREGVDIVVACPGRLEDHVQAGHAKLDAVEITVLDEADHMADLGFLPAVRRILEATPPDAQRLLFSATLDAGVDVLVQRFMTDPVTHSVDSAQSPVSMMTHHVLHVQGRHPAPGARRPDRRARAFAGLHPDEVRRQGADQEADRRGRARPSSCTATSPRAPARGTWRPSPTVRRRPSSPPTSRPAGSTSTTSRWSSTPIRRSSTRPTCTAPAGPPAPVPRARSSR